MKNIFKIIGKGMAVGAKKLWSLILEAGIGNVLKAGIFIGTSVASLVLYIKHLADRRKIIQMSVNAEKAKAETKAPVEVALDNNMADATVRKEELDPKYRREIASIIDDRCPKPKKNKRKGHFRSFAEMSKKRKKHVKSMWEELKADKDFNTNFDILIDQEKFKVDYAYKQYRDELANSGQDNYELIRIWNSPAWA